LSGTSETQDEHQGTRRDKSKTTNYSTCLYDASFLDVPAARNPGAMPRMLNSQLLPFAISVGVKDLRFESPPPYSSHSQLLTLFYWQIVVRDERYAKNYLGSVHLGCLLILVRAYL
jgi:hypothetical protein